MQTSLVDVLSRLFFFLKLTESLPGRQKSFILYKIKSVGCLGGGRGKSQSVLSVGLSGVSASELFRRLKENTKL